MISDECYISVDIEASGPIPGTFSMLSLGACLCDDQTITFESLFRPTSKQFIPEALEVTGLELDVLEIEGREPAESMTDFAQWVLAQAGSRRPVFVGLNAAFDWGFVNYYFHGYGIPNPFGIAPVDIKALYMGKFGTSWKEATSKQIAKRLCVDATGDHTALHDAIAQARLFNAVRASPA
jgi:ribonuclease T